MTAADLIEDAIERAVAHYVREMGRYEEAARIVERRVRCELRCRRIGALVSSRAKHPDDLRRKLHRKWKDRRASVEQLDRDVGAVVTDLAGCRVLTYRPTDVARVEVAVLEVLRPPEREGWLERHAKPSGYRATHILVQIDGNEERLWVRGAVCECRLHLLRVTSSTKSSTTSSTSELQAHRPPRR